MDEKSMDLLGEMVLIHYEWGHPLIWVLADRLREREEQG